MTTEDLIPTYVTFGQDHAHRVGGVTFDKDSVALIMAPSVSAGRERAFELFGPKFCTTYSQEPELRHFPRGVIPVERPGPESASVQQRHPDPVAITIETKYIPKQDAVVRFKRYGDGSLALVIESLTGERLCVATTAVEGAYVPPGLVLIKDYSENEGVLEALVKAGIVEEPTDAVASGFAMIPVCKLLVGGTSS